MGKKRTKNVTGKEIENSEKEKNSKETFTLNETKKLISVVAFVTNSSNHIVSIRVLNTQNPLKLEII